MSTPFDLAQLRTLVAVAECGGVSRAAKLLHLSQPTVSQHLRLLERRMGEPLTERVGRGIALNPAGDRLLIEARKILAVHDEAMSRLATSSARTLTIGSTETAADSLLPRLLAALKDAYPDQALRFRIDRSTAMLAAIDQGTIDIALFLSISQSSVGTRVGELSLDWFAAEGWRPPTTGDLPLVAYVEPCEMRQRAFTVLATAGSDVVVGAESTSLEGVIAAARAGLGVAVLPVAGVVPHGLARVSEMPDLGRIGVQVASRRGVDPELENTAVKAMRTFFADVAATG